MPTSYPRPGFDAWVNRGRETAASSYGDHHDEVCTQHHTLAANESNSLFTWIGRRVPFPPATRQWTGTAPYGLTSSRTFSFHRVGSRLQGKKGRPLHNASCGPALVQYLADAHGVVISQLIESRILR